MTVELSQDELRARVLIGQPARVAQGPAELIGVEVLLIVGELVQDLQVQGLDRGREALVVSGTPGGLEVRVREVRERRKQLLQLQERYLEVTVCRCPAGAEQDRRAAPSATRAKTSNPPASSGQPLR
jgi:hypothetical protein